MTLQSFGHDSHTTIRNEANASELLENLDTESVCMSVY